MKFATITLVLCGFCILLSLAACKPDPQPEPIEISYEDGILLANEGNFQGGNASLSFIGRENDTVVNDVFQSEVGRPLGDVAQSITVIGNRAYIVVNNSGKVEVVHLPTLTSACAITGMQSPRYLLALPSGRALVSDLYSKTIHVVDPGSCSVVGSIATSGWTEQMHLVGNRAMVTQTGTDKVLVIDATTETLIDSVAVGREPNSIVQDYNGNIWVLSGSALGQAVPRLIRLDRDSLEQQANFAFPSTQDSPSRLTYNAMRDTLYYLNGGIYRMSIDDAALPTQPWISGSGHTWYGLGIDPHTGWVYATDALDYQHRGALVRFSPATGAELKRWTVGLIPGEMVFLY